MASNSSTGMIKVKDESDDGVYIRPSKKKVIVKYFQIKYTTYIINDFY